MARAIDRDNRPPVAMSSHLERNCERSGSMRFGGTQCGAILVISLLILLVMTIIGIAAMSVTGLEEKMSGNLRNQNVAFQAAESAMRSGGDWLSSLTVEPAAVSTCASAPCNLWNLNVLPDLASQTQDWWESNAREYGTAGTQEISGVTADPRYTVEFQQYVQDSLDLGHTPPTGKEYYQVTARATGGTDTAVVILQTTYAQRFN